MWPRGGAHKLSRALEEYRIGTGTFVQIQSEYEPYSSCRDRMNKESFWIKC